MKLYYAPFACSLAAHIALAEAGLPFTTEKVDLRQKRTATGANFLEINPKGYVPALELSPGVVITEVTALLQWVADQAPATALAPAAGTLERVRLQEWLNFIATELHKQFSPLFWPTTTEAERPLITQRILNRVAFVDAQLADKAYLLGDSFSVADIYLFVVLSWAGFVKVDLSAYGNVAAWTARVGSRPAVGAALGAQTAA